MKIIVLLAVFATACSIPFNSKKPVYQAGLDNSPQFVGGCQQSSFAAGLDVTVAASSMIAGLAIEPTNDDETAIKAGAFVLAAVLTGSSIYGFVKSARCRKLHHDAELPTFGKSDWIWPPIMTTSVLAVAGLVAAASKGSGGGVFAPPSISTEPKTCNRDDATAQCADGTWSCTIQTSGACSGHGGVECRLVNLPTTIGGRLSEIEQCR
jgi:hypothetical protein